VSSSKSPRPSQGAGELSGLLRKAEALQKELDQAQSALKEQTVSGQDAGARVRMEVRGDGVPVSVQLELPALSDRDCRALEEAVRTALRVTMERLFELRRNKLGEVTRGLQPPGLFS